MEKIYCSGKDISIIIRLDMIWNAVSIGIFLIYIRNLENISFIIWKTDSVIRHPVIPAFLIKSRMNYFSIHIIFHFLKKGHYFNISCRKKGYRWIGIIF